MATNNCTACGSPGSSGGSLLGPLPPCHTNTCTIEWDDPRTTTPAGRIRANVNVHEAGALECLSDDTDTGLAVRIYGDEKALTSGCTPGGLHRDPVTNRLWIDPPPIRVCDEAAGGGCSSQGPGGKAEETYTGCAPAVCAKVRNSHCSKSMTVVPTLTLLGAEMNGGQATYEFGFKAASDPTTTWWGIFTGHAIKVTHIGADQVGHNVTRDNLATYSGSIRLPAITLAPGETYELCASPRLRYRNDDTGAVDVAWGAYTLSLDGYSCDGDGVLS